MCRRPLGASHNQAHRAPGRAQKTGMLEWTVADSAAIAARAGARMCASAHRAQGIRPRPGRPSSYYACDVEPQRLDCIEAQADLRAVRHRRRPGGTAARVVRARVIQTTCWLPSGSTNWMLRSWAWAWVKGAPGVVGVLQDLGERLLRGLRGNVAVQMVANSSLERIKLLRRDQHFSASHRPVGVAQGGGGVPGAGGQRAVIEIGAHGHRALAGAEGELGGSRRRDACEQALGG